MHIDTFAMPWLAECRVQDEIAMAGKKTAKAEEAPVHLMTEGPGVIVVNSHKYALGITMYMRRCKATHSTMVRANLLRGRERGVTLFVK
jgi:hypothetical protein